VIVLCAKAKEFFYLLMSKMIKPYCLLSILLYYLRLAFSFIHFTLFTCSKC
jgi:hypothetical protein